MKRILLPLFASVLLCAGAKAETEVITKARFHAGDNPAWINPDTDGNGWCDIDMSWRWNSHGIENSTGYGWYIVQLDLPGSILDSSDTKEWVDFNLGRIWGADEVYLNGKLIGSTGRMPDHKEGFYGPWRVHRNYRVDAKKGPIRWNQKNVLAIRVCNEGESGGMLGPGVSVKSPAAIDNTSLSMGKGKESTSEIKISNANKSSISGTLTVETLDGSSGRTIDIKSFPVNLKGSSEKAFEVAHTPGAWVQMNATYTDSRSGARTSARYVPKYILTPEAPASPRYNGPKVYGVRPGSPVIFRIPMSGEKPMRYGVRNLPEGLKVNPDNGVITGAIEEPGAYTMTLVAENTKGKAEEEFTIKVDELIGLTPPMGWNSWNCWGWSVSQDRVMSSAKALLDHGLVDYGYSYVNVDDAWEAPERNPDGTIGTNEKFPDMKGLGDWLHENGLKFGIYSSPGKTTCGGYLGSLGHEKQDAETYNSWGIDYLKYDWCSYAKEYDKIKHPTTADYIWPYLLMQQYLRQQPRDIFYSMGQFALGDVWKWGPSIDANSWRTTLDITDTWESLYSIGFEQQAELWPYAGPGHWNDPDMLVVGKVGWSEDLRDSRLTPDEQYTHISLWALLAANMLIGCDLAQIDDFTFNLLCNNEVNAVNQDILGRQAKREIIDGDIQIWKRPLDDGSYAVGIFNVGTDNKTVDFRKYFSSLGIGNLKSARDLWKQQDLDPDATEFFIPNHGVKFLRITY